MLSLENATGIEVRGRDLIIVGVGQGIKSLAVTEAVVIENYAEMGPAQLSELVAREMKSKKISAENIILGLPRDQLVVRTVELPIEVEENLEQVVQFQAEKFEPIDGEPSFCDAVMVSRDEALKKIRLQIILSPTMVLEEPMSLLEQLGLYPTAVRISDQALHHLLRVHADGFPSSSPCLIIDAAPGSVAFNLVVGAGQAYSAKAHLGEKDYNLRNVLHHLHQFVSEIDLDDDELSKLYLMGEWADRIESDLKAQFEDCELLWESSELSFPSQHQEDRDRLSAAAGLALSGLESRGAYNLLPPERRIVKRKPSWIPTAALVLVGILLGGAVIARDFVQSQQLLDRVDHEVNIRQDGVDATMELRNLIDDKNQQLEDLRTLLKGNRTVLRVLYELTEKLPDESYLESLNLTNGRLNMTGHSDKAAQLLNILLESACLENVEQKFIIPGSDGKERFRFEAQVVNCSSQQ